jgi:hypothetical protein
VYDFPAKDNTLRAFFIHFFSSSLDQLETNKRSSSELISLVPHTSVATTTHFANSASITVVGTHS